MRKRILVATLVITMLGLVLFSLATTTVSYRTLIENTEAVLTVQVNSLNLDAYTDDPAGAVALSDTLDGMRVTFMDASGNITGDSANAEVGSSRADRPEVAGAIEDGIGSSVRRSDTTGKDTLYVCRRVGDRLVRLATQTASQRDVIVDTLPTLAWFLALDVVFCLIFSFFATAYMLKPVEELAKKSRTEGKLSTKYPELNPITEILNRKNEEIEQQMAVIASEKQRVERVQESKNEFISNVSHEMNTPLTSIKGFAELLERGDLDEETKKKAYRIIRTQADRLTGLISCIINFNELENDELPCYDCDVSQIAKDVAESLRADIEKNGLTLTVDAEERVTVPSRTERLTEIFGNLIRNATKYNKEGGSISVTVKGDKNPYAEVTDTGIGIAEDNLDKIFSRFFTVDKSHNGKHGGFGLGLAVVRKLCDRAGWKLTVKSVLGEGTTFRIEF